MILLMDTDRVHLFEDWGPLKWLIGNSFPTTWNLKSNCYCNYLIHIGALSFCGQILSKILGNFLLFANFWTIFCQIFCLLKKIVKLFALIFVIFFALCNFLHLLFCSFSRLTIFSTFFFGIFCGTSFCQKFVLIFYPFFVFFLRHKFFSTFVFGIFAVPVFVIFLN